MGYKYEILASHYPFNGYYEESYCCSTLWAAMKKFREYKHKGYEIINIYYRDIKETITWQVNDL